MIKQILTAVWRSIQAASIRRAREILANHNRGTGSWQ